jgi:CheY-like chemotaxis protein
MLVEDDQVDARTVRRALADVGGVDAVIHLTNGEDALHYLRDSANEKPCIILLDLNMPKMNGFEFLSEIKKDPAIRRIPVVVLTTSKENRDISGTFKHSIAGYMVKPIHYEEFVHTIQAISEYWALSLLPVEA